MTRDPNTSNGMSFGHGYYEARIRMPPAPEGFVHNTRNKGTGDDGYSWPAFWSQEHKAFINNGEARFPYIELDFMESQRKDEVLWTMWSWLEDKPAQTVKNRKSYFTRDGFDMSDWHTYGTLWAPGKLEFYVDDEFWWGHYFDPNDPRSKDPQQNPSTLEGGNYVDKPNAVREPFAQFDTKGVNPVLDVILGSGTGRPFDTDWVRIWQKD